MFAGQAHPGRLLAVLFLGIGAVAHGLPWADQEPTSAATTGKILAPLPADKPAPPKVGINTHNPIDQFIAAEWRERAVRPAPACSDEAFLRRVCLDIAGVIPSLEQAGQFLEPRRRDRPGLIDKLLDSPRYADHWTIYWGDLLRERSFIRGMPDFAFRDYIRQSLRDNKPYDEWVREMITAKGEAEDAPAVALVMRHEANADELTITTSQVFLGTELKCAQCHNHKFEPWLKKDFEGMSGFWKGTRTRRSGTRTVASADGSTVRQVPILEVLDVLPGRGRFLTGGDAAQGEGREVLAEFIVSRDNPYFARVAVNRIWARLMGAGLVDPPDRFSVTNTPSHPALLDWLALEFIEHGYDLKHVIRLICNSRTYQLASTGGVLPSRIKDTRLYQRMPLRRMTAEQLHDSILQACGLLGRDEPGLRPAIEKRYPAPAQSFRRTFGSHDRQSIHDRDAEATIPQALELLNGRFINRAVDLGERHPVRRWADGGFTAETAIRKLFMLTLTREPTRGELRLVKKHIKESGGAREPWSDLHWALINTREFMFLR